MKNTLCLLLCRNQSKYISVLEQTFKKTNIDTLIIDDSVIDNSLPETDNFTNLGRLRSNNQTLNIISWDKSFYIISAYNLVNQYDYFFFIEDDVYTKKPDTIVNFIEHFACLDYDLLSRGILSIENDPEWPGWSFKDDHEYRKLFKNIYRSYNPFCRLSNKLISTILEFKNNYNKFYFHEILFASLCVDNGLKYYDYKNDKECGDKYIGVFTYRPVISKQDIHDNKIYHPVKDAKDNA